MYVQTKRREVLLSWNMETEALRNDNGGRMKQIEQLDDIEKAQLLIHLGRIYRKGAMQTMLGLQGMVEDCDSASADVEIASKIRLILRGMEKEEALILIRDFFEIGKSDWWKDQYEEQDYLEKKRFAMDAFLRCLYA